MSSTLSILETSTSLHNISNQSLLENKRISKINKNLYIFAKEEITSFSSIKVKVYKEEIEDQKDENKIKIPKTFKSFFEDFKKNDKKNNCDVNQIESGLITSSKFANSDQIGQVDSSDLVNSE